jgi:hypothetical protein
MWLGIDTVRQTEKLGSNSFEMLYEMTLAGSTDVIGIVLG